MPGDRSVSRDLDKFIQRQGRHLMPVLENDSRFYIMPEDDMQNHPVIGRVFMVMVRPPAAGFNMNFNVAPEQTTPRGDNRIA
jgi:hypothetical protein